MTIKERLAELIFDFEEEISKRGISFPPGISELDQAEKEEVLALLNGAWVILDRISETDVRFAIENLDFKEQQEVYADLAFFQGASDKETAFISLREKSRRYSDLQKILARHEFSKIKNDE